MESIQEIVRSAETNYVNGSISMGKYVEWSMYDTIETIDAYLNSKHISGETDSLGRPKPFFNIVTAAVNIWYRATDLDRKDVKFRAKNEKGVPLALVANIILQNWMEDNKFGLFLNQWGRSLARYGSSVVKFVEQDGELVPSVIPWNRFIADSVDFDAIPKIERLYKTPAQLRKMKHYNQGVVDQLITAVTTRKNTDGTVKDNENDFIELYEVHGELDTRMLEDEPDLNIEDKDVKYTQQMHVVSFVAGEKDGEFDDFTLFKGREKKDPYMITHLIEEDGRTLSIGATEYLFDSQWMQNHSVKNMKDTLDIVSKLIMQTSDPKYAGRNVLNSLETGDIFIHAVNQPLTRVANDKPDISALQNFGQMWHNLSQEITSTPDALRGTTLPSGTPYSLGSYLGGQASSLFEVMLENKGLHLEEMIKEYVIPHITKKLDNTDDIVGMLDDNGVVEIDSIYISKKAKRNFNRDTFNQAVFGNGLVVPFNKEQEEGKVKDALSSQGNRRTFKTDEERSKTWAEIFANFDWSNVRVEITGEQQDKQAVLTTLATVLQSIGSNPAMLQDPNAKLVFNNILREVGTISPIQLSTSQGATPPPQAPQPTSDLKELSKIQ